MWWAAEQDFWVITDPDRQRVWKLLPLPHPNYWRKQLRDEAYGKAKNVIDLMLQP